MKCNAVKVGKSGRTVKGIYGWWSEGPVKIGVQYLWSNNIRNYIQYFLPILLLYLCALLLTAVGLLCIELLSYVYFCYLMCIVLLCVYCCLTYFSCRIAG